MDGEGFATCGWRNQAQVLLLPIQIHPSELGGSDATALEYAAAKERLLDCHRCCERPRTARVTAKCLVATAAKLDPWEQKP